MSILKGLRQDFVAESVNQATGLPEFEDGLWTGVHLEDSWCPSRVRTNPVVKMAPCLTLGAHPGRCRPRFPRFQGRPNSYRRVPHCRPGNGVRKNI